MSRVRIVGAGAAGMLCGVYAARAGHDVQILEKNEKAGKKLYITGKGRCNVTNDRDTRELLAAVMSNPRFLYSAFYSYGSRDVMDFFEQAGVPLKTERGGRVFPVSDHASDIIRALERELERAGGRIRLQTRVEEILTEDGKAVGVRTGDGEILPADAVIVATGGLSYPSTGSTGDGYRFAGATGHQVTEQSPSLVPLMTGEEYTHRLAGLSLKNVELNLKAGKKTVYQDFGEMMFTHFGVTGPLILSASARIGPYLKKEELQAYLDLKPALSADQLDTRILREFSGNPNRQFKNVIGVIFPSSLRPVMLELGGISPEKRVNEITREERKAFGELVKAFPFTATGMGEFKEAVITRGGVSVKDVVPGTMESRRVKGLYFIGEVLDLDALTGGYNLQIAWSTAAAAARAIP
ncbi:MAG: NAD(P)/FAD-dependent oxidoreductase [Clostridiales bacterium]|nr:NAD(P)/FAD-dependent oxidoreductase [Clostridiales bacterium]